MKKRNFSFHFSKTRISAIMSEGYYHKGMIAHNSKKRSRLLLCNQLLFLFKTFSVAKNNAPPDQRPLAAEGTQEGALCLQRTLIP